MAILDRDKLKGKPVSPKLEEKLRRGRKAMLRDSANRRLAVKFERGEQYWGLNGKGQLIFQDSVSQIFGGRRPPHRIRNRYNFIHPIVEGKISQATQRVPSYEIVPSTIDPNDRSAAKVSEKVALYGYDKWKIRRATVKAVKHALVMGEGFAMPYFDPNVGPFIPDPEDPKKFIGRGEIKIMTLSANEVYWEDGCEFDESPWWAIERAMPIDEVEAMPGFVGGKLVPDATSHDVPTDRQGENQVLVTRYLERPSKQHPKGRMEVMANKHVIVPAEPYPCVNAQGEVVDEPVLHRLSYIVDPESDRDRGLVWQLIDLQRTINDCWNKILEWKNRCLNPQLLAPVNSLVNRPSDEPGSVVYYRPQGGLTPQWEQSAKIPTELFQILDQAIQHMRAIAADVDPQAEPDVAAKSIQAVIEQSRQRWQTFLGDLAEWHSRLMRHCLSLASVYYTEPRLVTIKGSLGAEAIRDFKGADLRSQVDVRVSPQSLEVRSRKAVFEETAYFAQAGWITPQAAMARINGGIGGNLADNYENDVRKAWNLILKIKAGEQELFNSSTRTETMPDGSTVETPDWMPQEFDDVDVWEQVFVSWMKTEEYEMLESPQQEAAKLVYQALKMQKMRQQMEEAAMQTMMAEAQGMGNAAAPQGPKPLPDQAQPNVEA